MAATTLAWQLAVYKAADMRWHICSGRHDPMCNQACSKVSNMLKATPGDGGSVHDTLHNESVVLWQLIQCGSLLLRLHLRDRCRPPCDCQHRRCINSVCHNSQQKCDEQGTSAHTKRLNERLSLNGVRPPRVAALRCWLMQQAVSALCCCAEHRVDCSADCSLVVVRRDIPSGLRGILGAVATVVRPRHGLHIELIDLLLRHLEQRKRSDKIQD